MTGLRLWVDSPWAVAPARAKKIAAPSTRSGSAIAIFTNDREKLGAALGHDVSHSSAHAPEMKPEQKQEQAVTPQREIAPQQEQGEDFGLGL